jgi:hypothetical protein
MVLVIIVTQGSFNAQPALPWPVHPASPGTSSTMAPAQFATASTLIVINATQLTALYASTDTSSKTTPVTLVAADSPAATCVTLQPVSLATQDTFWRMGHAILALPDSQTPSHATLQLCLHV